MDRNEKDFKDEKDFADLNEEDRELSLLFDNWTETDIYKYQEIIDWKLLSKNYSVQTSSMLEKYENKLDWNVLSEVGDFSTEVLYKYFDKWNWEILSGNRSAFQQLEQVEEFKDKIVWSEFIKRGTYYEDYFTFDFVKKYKSYIPADEFFRSEMWKWLRTDKEEEILEKILIMKEENQLLRKISDGLKANEWKNKPFNIFNALKIESRENRHSAFIANLLNPEGTHLCGNFFLRTFIEMLKSKEKYSQVKEIIDKLADNVWVNTEKDLKNNSRVDVWIKNKTENFYLLIENKIYAGDEDKQLFRYRNYLGGHEKEGRNSNGERRIGVLLYLTVNGKDASPDSTGGIAKNQNDGYYTISYNVEIKEWLETCLKKDLLKEEKYERVKSAIEQYLELIDFLTINIKLRDELLKEFNNKDIINKALEYNKNNDKCDFTESILKYMLYELKKHNTL